MQTLRMLNISIPKPCHEDWGAMTPTTKGAFCAACAKEVMDFSNMSDDEVKNYFLLNAGKKTCGRFRKSQLKGLNIVVDEQVIYTNISLWKKFLAVVVICFGAFFTSCTSDRTTSTTLLESASYTVTERPGEDTTLDTVKKGSAFPGYSKSYTKRTMVVGAIPIFVPYEEIYIQGNMPAELEIDKEQARDTITAVPGEKDQPKDTLKKLIDTCANPAFL